MLCGPSVPNKQAVFQTTAGNFTVELFTDDMPITAYNFIDLDKKGFTMGYISTALSRIS